ncbi:hypothetical protein [Hydrogenophaga sp.]|uniref:hypothetical protein n=1 Tax=Hydrogenophaga sp. TaxID=1904254 RepID=UPI00273204ED|nr:hypothetical protein [Hydrogenophaga sp.]MDP2073403.1 hypothetical protein [Hydrogenophaga sp.]MDP3106791.1 hypothetical protein [Hydrogenophaga sp.]
MKEYYDVFDELSAANQMGRRAILIFELTNNSAFSWYGVTSDEVRNHVVHSGMDPQLYPPQEVSDSDYLKGIDWWIDVRCTAENWAVELAREFFDESDESPDEVNLHSSIVDSFLSIKSDEIDSLSKVREENPMLYGEICLEVSRQLEMLVGGGAHSS